MNICIIRDIFVRFLYLIESIQHRKKFQITIGKNIYAKSFALQNIIFEPPTAPVHHAQLVFWLSGPPYRFEEAFGMFECRLGKYYLQPPFRTLQLDRPFFSDVE